MARNKRGSGVRNRKKLEATIPQYISIGRGRRVLNPKWKPAPYDPSNFSEAISAGTAMAAAEQERVRKAGVFPTNFSLQSPITNDASRIPVDPSPTGTPGEEAKKQALRIINNDITGEGIYWDSALDRKAKVDLTEGGNLFKQGADNLIAQEKVADALKIKQLERKGMSLQRGIKGRRWRDDLKALKDKTYPEE